MVVYQTNTGEVFNVLLDNETVWLSLNQMAELFQRDKSVISRHIKNVFKEGELVYEATVAKNATVQFEGERQIIRQVDYYNLDVIISVGYRVKSQRGTQFRMWATKVLKEYLLKGYAIHRPVSKKELDEVREELEQQIENLEVAAENQFNEIYTALITLVSKKQEPEKPRKIGFVTKYQDDK